MSAEGAVIAVCGDRLSDDAGDGGGEVDARAEDGRCTA